MLHGRGAERARLDGVVAGAAASRGAALVVRGEPGVGKTALLSDLGERTGDATVLWTAGIESESPLAFAALHRLLRPLLGRLDDIPHVQAHALRRAYGEFLRRNRRRIDARTHLGTALRVFTELRAEPCAERARQELRASGGTARKRDVTTAGDLTPQERQTALLVSAGLANRDIAARLFLSPRTVEYHLSNVYSKLGVRSRVELAQLQLS